MTPISNELNSLKTNIINMFSLVIHQFENSRTSVESTDKDLLEEIARLERRVDVYELKLNMDCENVLALFSPVANNLRFVLSILRTNYSLERIGDYLYNIACILRDLENPVDPEVLKEMQISRMFDISLEMLKIISTAFENQDSQQARQIFKKDNLLDEILMKSNKTANEIIIRKPEETLAVLSLLTVIRKLERVGDQTKNIAEELIYFLEAKVLRHANQEA
jgi:phosphate transport system protein